MSAASGALTSGRWMLRPNSVPRAASAGTVTDSARRAACSGCARSPWRAQRIHHVFQAGRPGVGLRRRRAPELHSGAGVIWDRLRVEPGRLGRVRVDDDLGDARQRARRPVERSQLLEHLGDLLVVDHGGPGVQPARVVLVNQPRPASSSSSMREEGRFVLPDAAKGLSGHGAILTDIADRHTQECGD